ncbi:MAG: ribokinase [Prevotella sp.]|nr:ribokinase [Prevotella sp.]
MERKKKIVVVGSFNTDLVISTDRHPRPGETLIGHGFMANFGGKGANQAVAAARLGGDVAFVACMGRDAYGQQGLEHLEKEGVDTTHITRSEQQPTGIAVITVDAKGENTIIVDSGANGLLSPEDIHQSADVFSQASIILMQLETPIPALTEAARLGKQHGALIVLNPAPAPKTPLPLELLQHVDLLIPNQTEAESISGIAVGDLSSAQSAIERLRTMGINNTIITMGSQGASLMEDGEIRLIASYPAHVVDTTAAGDTFCGALCTALSEGKTMAEAADFACKASSITVSRKGAQQSLPYRKEINLNH